MRRPLLVRLVMGGAIATGAVFGVASQAAAFPPGESPHISCDWITIDPPPASWIKVEFYGTINGVPYQRTVQYGAPTPHLAKINIRALTALGGTVHITSTANGGWLGISPASAVTLTCDPDNSVHSATEVSMKRPPGPQAQVLAATTTVLPFTGSTVWFEALAGLVALLAGTAALAGAHLWRGCSVVRKALRVYV